MKKNQQIEWQPSAKTVREPQDLSWKMYKKQGGPGGLRATDQGVRREYFNGPSSRTYDSSVSQAGSSKNQGK